MEVVNVEPALVMDPSLTMPSVVVRRVDWLEDSHALVNFDNENSSSIVPLKRVERQDGLRDGDPCKVTWSNGKKYNATFICSGSMTICAERQEELFEDELSDDTAEGKQSLQKSCEKPCKDDTDESSQGDQSSQKSCEKPRQKKRRKLLPTNKPVGGKDKENKGKKLSQKPADKKAKSLSKKPKEFDMWVGKSPNTPTVTATVNEESSNIESSSSLSDDGDGKSGSIVVKHYTSKRKHYDEVLGELSKISKEQEVRFHEIKQKLQDISNDVKTLAATNIANHLVHVKGKGIVSQPPASSTPTTPTSSDQGQDKTESCNEVELINVTPKGVEAPIVEVKTSPLSYSKELLTSAEITPIYVRSQSRRNFAALLVKNLFDVETRMRSNVAGRGKEKLDPEVMKFVKAKVFEYYECNPSEIKEEWSKCIVSIDEKSRALKKLKKKV